MATVTATFVCVFLACFSVKALSVTVDAADHSGKSHKGRSMIRQEDKMLKVEGNASTERAEDCTLDVQLGEDKCICGEDKCKSSSTKARVCTTATEPTSPTCEDICNVITSASTMDDLRNTAKCMCAGSSGSNPAYTECNSEEICNGNTCKAMCDGENPVGEDDVGCICEAVDGSTPAYTWCTSGYQCKDNTCQVTTTTTTTTSTMPVCTLDVELGVDATCICGTDEDGDDVLCESSSSKKWLCTGATAPTCEVICKPNKKSCMCAGSGSPPAYTRCTSQEECSSNTCQAVR